MYVKNICFNQKVNKQHFPSFDEVSLRNTDIFLYKYIYILMYISSVYLFLNISLLLTMTKRFVTSLSSLIFLC